MPSQRYRDCLGGLQPSSKPFNSLAAVPQSAIRQITQIKFSNPGKGRSCELGPHVRFPFVGGDQEEVFGGTPSIPNAKSSILTIPE